MVEKVYDILSKINIPLDHIHRPEFNDNNMVISYHFYNVSGAKFGDGLTKVTIGTLQVDLFVKHDGKTNPNDTKKRIKDLLKENKFLIVNHYEDSEYVSSIGEIDHYIFIFKYKEGK